MKVRLTHLNTFFFRPPHKPSIKAEEQRSQLEEGIDHFRYTVQKMPAYLSCIPPSIAFLALDKIRLLFSNSTMYKSTATLKS